MGSGNLIKVIITIKEIDDKETVVRLIKAVIKMFKAIVAVISVMKFITLFSFLLRFYFPFIN